MKIGISIDVENMDQLNRHLIAAKESGYRYCQLFYRGDDINESLAKEIMNLCEKYSMEIGPIGGYINALKPSEITMGYTLDKLFRLIDIMPYFNSQELLIWSGTLSDEHMFQKDDRNHTPEAFKQLRNITEAILKRMESIGGKLIFEPFFTHILHDENSILTFIEELGTERVKVVFDPPNFMTVERFKEQDKTLTTLFETLHRVLAGVHFKDIKLLNNESWPFDYPGPGNGELNYELLADLIKRYQYQSWGIIEHVQPDQFKAAREFIERSLSNSQ